MNVLTELVLALFLLTVLWLSASSRLLHCIRLTAWQGWFIALYPLVSWPWVDSVPCASVWLIAAVTVLLKGFFLPYLLRRAMVRAEVKRELEPLVGYGSSLFIVTAFAACAFLFCSRYLPCAEGAAMLNSPAAFTAIFAGLFLIMARRKAITQAIGFLLFENGITLFGMGMMLEYGLLVELGILLDVFVLVFVMGIAVFHINREFAHIDTDRLNLLGDYPATTEDKR